MVLLILSRNRLKLCTKSTIQMASIYIHRLRIGIGLTQRIKLTIDYYRSIEIGCGTKLGPDTLGTKIEIY
ncbi:hypothetical protein D3C73_1490360 [compost metagenome]